jgi:hypothetical protein
MLFIHRDTGYLHTQRFTGSAWAGIVPQPQGGGWVAAVGANIDDETMNVYEHTQNSDDCRTQDRTCLVDPFNPNQCFTTDGVNWAEVMFNEARGETIGAQAMVGWTIRNRAYQGLSCDSYPGAQGGGTVTRDCRENVPCSDPDFCDDSKRVCCVIHGGQFRLGTSGYQFNDEHVDMVTLSLEGFLTRAWHLAEGRLLDMSNPGWKPSGISGCPNPLTCGTETSGGPLCTSGFNITELPSAGGPMEFRNRAYTPDVSSCKRVTGFICGDTNDQYNNYFWNRKPS